MGYADDLIQAGDEVLYEAFGEQSVYTSVAGGVFPVTIIVDREASVATPRGASRHTARTAIVHISLNPAIGLDKVEAHAHLMVAFALGEEPRKARIQTLFGTDASGHKVEVVLV